MPKGGGEQFLVALAAARIYSEAIETLVHHVQINGLKKFLVRLPGFTYQGLQHPPCETTFTEKSGVFVAPINC